MTKAQRRKHQAKVRAEKRRVKAAPKKALKQWSIDVMERDNHRCVVCGTKATFRIDKNTGQKRVFKSGNRKGQIIIVPLNAHHILPKEVYKEFKFMIINGVALCPQHHKHSKFSAHRNAVWFSEWLKLNRPRQWKWAVQNMGSVD